MEHAPPRGLAVGLAAICAPTAGFVLWMTPARVLEWRGMVAYGGLAALVVGSVLFALRLPVVPALAAGVLGWPVGGMRDRAMDDRIFAAARTDADELRRYLDSPATRHRDEARRLMTDLAWEDAKKIGTVDVIRRYASRFPGAHDDDVRAAIHARYASLAVADDLRPVVDWLEAHGPGAHIVASGCEDVQPAIVSGLRQALPPDVLVPADASELEIHADCRIGPSGEVYESPTGMIDGVAAIVHLAITAPGIRVERDLIGLPPDRVEVLRILSNQDHQRTLGRLAVNGLPKSVADALRSPSR